MGEADSTDSFSIYASRLSTTCSIISESDHEYIDYVCNLKEDNLQVPMSTLCPNACESSVPSNGSDSSDSSDGSDSSDCSDSSDGRNSRDGPRNKPNHSA